MNKYVKAVTANFAFFGISTLFFLFITPTAIHIMGDEFFGLWSILNSILGFSRIGELGLSIVIKKFASEKTVGDSEINGIITSGIVLLLPMAFISAGILIGTREWLIVQFDISPDAYLNFNAAIFILAITLIPQFLLRIAHGYFLSQLQNTFIRFVELFTHILIWSGAIVIATIQRDVFLISLWMFVVKSMILIVLFTVIKKKTGFNLIIDKSVIKRMSKFSLYSFFDYVARLIYQQLDRVLVGIVLGPAIAGVYSVGTSIGLRLSIITGQVTSVLVPYASRKTTENKNSELLKNYHNISRLLNMLVLVMGGILIVWMEEILSIWISLEYARNYALLFCLIAMGYIFISLSRSGHQTLVGIGKVETSAIIYMITGILMSLGIFWFSSTLGMLGLGLAKFTSILLLILNGFTYYELKGSISIRDLMANFGWAVIAAFMGLGLVYFDASLLLRIIFSISLISFAGLQILRDEFTLRQIKGIINTMREQFNESRN